MSKKTYVGLAPRTAQRGASVDVGATSKPKRKKEFILDRLYPGSRFLAGPSCARGGIGKATPGGPEQAVVGVPPTWRESAALPAEVSACRALGVAMAMVWVGSRTLHVVPTPRPCVRAHGHPCFNVAKQRRAGFELWRPCPLYDHARPWLKQARLNK